MSFMMEKGESIAASLATKFASNVIEKWTRYRAENFFEEFQHRLIEGHISGDQYIDVADDIDDILSDEKGSEVVYDAYRRVSLSSSKDIGPRIIGVLTAELCIAKEYANDEYELFFSIAEMLNDRELVSVSTLVNEWFETIDTHDAKYKAGAAYVEDGCLKYVLDSSEVEISSSAVSLSGVEISADNLLEQFGSGLQKLRQLGAVRINVQQIIYHYHEDTERYIDHDGTIQETIRLVYIPLKYRRIFALIRKMSKKPG